MLITETVVRKLLKTVDAGLSKGVGKPIPGQMCVEAAICYALGEPHSDGPSCVEPAIRNAKIRLNDAAWSSPQARARGMRRAAIAQLGSRGVVNGRTFAVRYAELTIRQIVPLALRAAALRVPAHAGALEAAAGRCEAEGTLDAARGARATAAAATTATAAYAATTAAAAAAADAAAYAAAADAAAYAAYAADAADATTRDRILSVAADLQVQVMQELGSPGCAWLWLCEEVAP